MRTDWDGEKVQIKDGNKWQGSQLWRSNVFFRLPTSVHEIGRRRGLGISDVDSDRAKHVDGSERKR